MADDKMKTFYCLQSEIYDDGSVKAAVFSQVCKAKPKNSFKDTPISDCYKNWYDTQARAEAALAQYKQHGRIHIPKEVPM